jgi:hypothetical protein
MISILKEFDVIVVYSKKKQEISWLKTNILKKS